MRIFKTKWFQKWAAREGMENEALLAAVVGVDGGLIDAELDRHVIKKRVVLPSRQARWCPRSGGLPACQYGIPCLWICKERTGEHQRQGAEGTQAAGNRLPGYTHPALVKAIKAGELIEVTKDG